MDNEIQTVESILSSFAPAIEVPESLKGQTGRVMSASYRDVLLLDGYGFEFVHELESEIFEQFRKGIGQTRTAIFALCNRYGVITGPLTRSLNIGTVFSRVQDETIWHVDRSDKEDEYYTLLSPANSTVAMTWVSPILHFLTIANEELQNYSVLEVLETIKKLRKTTGNITDRISEIADLINIILNTSLSENRKRTLLSRIEEKSVLIGGKNNWLLFSDPLVIHNGNDPKGTDKYIFTFDLARRYGEEFRSVYDCNI